ncbi:hypothetical protein Hanom_Chr09g00826691 [Helianthus anomalus]
MSFLWVKHWSRFSRGSSGEALILCVWTELFYVCGDLLFCLLCGVFGKKMHFIPHQRVLTTEPYINI